MPYLEPEPDDPMVRIGVGLPAGGTEALHAMAECFAEEFLRMGYTKREVMALFRSPFYAAPHQAYRVLGEDAIASLVDRYAEIFTPTLRTEIRNEGD